MKILTFTCAIWYIEIKLQTASNPERSQTRMTFGAIQEQGCKCGREHRCALECLLVGKGVISKTAEALAVRGINRPFLLADVNTYAAAGDRVSATLDAAGIPFSKYIFNEKSLEPDERAVGSAIMHFDTGCDAVVAIGSGVIGDIAKILAKTADLPYIIVATAPSMDGYASASSSMEMDGVKVSLSSKCPEVIIGDVDVLKNAPTEMLISGLGDMLAKYISIAEWRISNLITGEYYCEEIAALVRSSLKLCVDNASGLLLRDETAVEAVFNGLVVAGAAMSLAGASRPASGVEHYFSHVWDMRATSLGTAASTHGIQCAIATLIAARLYEKILTVNPDCETAIKHTKAFSYPEWAEALREFIGEGAEAMIALEAKEGKYSVEKHATRIERIIDKWNELTEIVKNEIPSSEEIERILDSIGCPKSPAEIGIDNAIIPMTFKATKDIRDKYVLSRLAFDLGVIDTLTDGI